MHAWQTQGHPAAHDNAKVADAFWWEIRHSESALHKAPRRVARLGAAAGGGAGLLLVLLLLGCAARGARSRRAAEETPPASCGKQHGPGVRDAAGRCRRMAAHAL